MTVRLQGAGIRSRLATMLAQAIALACLIGVVAATAESAQAGPRETYISHAKGRIVPIPKDIGHQPGAYIDRRLLGNIRYIDQRFGPIYITEGYAGPLRGRGTVGCPDCHVSNSDHFTGLALDIAVPGSGTCDRRWRRITALAKWAEPRQDIVRAPFRWVGYDGDTAHGCGHHLHLSWNSAPTRSFRVARWVELLKVGDMQVDGGRVALRPSGGSEVPTPGDGGNTGGISPN